MGTQILGHPKTGEEIKASLMSCDCEVQRIAERIQAMARGGINTLALDACSLQTVKKLLEAIDEDIANLADTVSDIAARHGAANGRAPDPILDRLYEQALEPRP